MTQVRIIECIREYFLVKNNSKTDIYQPFYSKVYICDNDAWF